MGGNWQQRIVVAVVAGAAACGRGGGVAARAEDRLVLEVGGAQHSLRAALLAAGVRIEPVRSKDPEAADEAVPTSPRHAGTVDEPPPEPAPPAWFEVLLAEGQTPIHLARRHLGDGNRFREILALNGWSEDDARRLRPGQKVKIPAVGGIRAQDRR